MIKKSLVLSFVYALCIITIGCSGSYERELAKKADEHYSNEEYDEAVNNYLKLLDSGKKDFDLYMKIADCYFNMQNYASSLKMYRQALKKKENSAEALLGIGRVFSARSEYSLATEYFKTAIKDAKSEIKAKCLVEIGKIRMITEDGREEAGEYFKKAIDAYKSGDIYYEAIKYYSGVEKYNEVVTLGEKGTELDFEKEENKALLYFELSKAYKNLNNLKKALDAAFNAVKLLPDNATLVANYNAVYYDWKKMSEEIGDKEKEK